MKGDAVARFVIALIVLGSWATINYGVFFGAVQIPMHIEPLAQRALGILDAVLLTVVGYFYHTSSSSQKKTDLLAKAPPVADEVKP